MRTQAHARPQHTLRDLNITLKLNDVPTPAKVLGFAGTIPFLFGTYTLVKGRVPNEHTALAQLVQLNYSACILRCAALVCGVWIVPDMVFSQPLLPGLQSCAVED